MKLVHVCLWLAILACPAFAERAAQAVPGAPPILQTHFVIDQAWKRTTFRRRLSSEEKQAPLARELEEAVLRIEAIYDPTRLDGPAFLPRLEVARSTFAIGSAERAAPWRIAVAAPPVPVFASPLPGSRMSSEAFWAKRRNDVEQARTWLRRKWRSERSPAPQ